MMRPMTDASLEADSPAGRARWTRIAFWSALAAIVGVHVGLAFYFDHPVMWLRDQPMSGADFDIHIEQTWRVIAGLEGWGKTWVYDTQLLAGCPNGVIFDADNKGWELLTYVLWRLGLSKGTAFNCFIFLAHLLPLPVTFLSARMFGLSRPGALVAMAMGSSLWLFDSFAHWGWYIGMVAYVMAAYFFLLPLALYFRFLQERRWWHAVLATVLIGCAHLVHPYTFFILVGPMAALYATAFRRLGRAGHVAVAGIVLGVLAINACWLIPALAFWHYILDSAYFGAGTLRLFALDFFGLLVSPVTSGIIGTRTGFRFLFIAAAVVMLVIWRRERDQRFMPFAVGLGLLLGLSYLGGYISLTAQIQPYRHVLPAAYMSVIPAAALCETLWRRGVLAKLSRTARVALGLLAIPAAQHLASDVIYYFPDKLPEVEPLLEGTTVPITATGYGPQYNYRHFDMPPVYHRLADWVREHDDGQSRFLIQVGEVGEQLLWTTEAQILGGFQHRNLAQAYSNLFRRSAQGIVSQEELREYLETYGVKWVIVTFRKGRFDLMTDVLEHHADVREHTIYRAKIEPSLFVENFGTVDIDINQIAVHDTDPDRDVVLRFHFLETLVCEPGCSIAQDPVPGAPIAFIRIPAPHPADFTIENRY